MHGFSLGNNWPSRTAPTSRRGLLYRLSLAVGFVIYYSTCYILSNPYLLRAMFAVIRCVRAITVIIGKLVVVSKSSDVREILHRFGDFSLADVLGPKMPWGPIILSLDWREQHDRERALLQSVVSPFETADIDMVRAKVAVKCRDLIAQKRTCGEIDVVTDLSNCVVADLIEYYFGVPVIDDYQEMARILGDVAGYILVPPPVTSKRSERAHMSMARLTQTVLNRVEEQDKALGAVPSAPTPADDLLIRLVKRRRRDDEPPGWFNDDWIRRCITGLAATGGGTIVRATTQAMDRLIAHPAGLQEARELAVRLDAGGDEAIRVRLRQITYEALRFRPMLPLLLRYCPRETVIANGTRRARMAPAGAMLIAPPIGAMFDPEVFEHPARFKSNRPLTNYLHFGCGLRTCFGKYVADVVIVEIIRSLLLLPNLRRPFGGKGLVRYDGPVATSFRLKFDPENGCES